MKLQFQLHYSTISNLIVPHQFKYCQHRRLGTFTYVLRRDTSITDESFETSRECNGDRRRIIKVSESLEVIFEEFFN